MGGKNRATPAHLSPDETPAQDEQRTLREPLFQDACACNFSRSLSCCTGWHQKAAKRRRYPWIPLRRRKPFVSRRTPAWDFR